MDMDSAAVFLAGTILYAIGLIIILIATIIANNLIHKYWKSFGWQFMSWVNPEPTRFMTPEEAEKVAPTLDPVSKEPHKAK
jgi:energy-coupling factor transporter transmembrane protein EcfT